MLFVSSYPHNILPYIIPISLIYSFELWHTLLHRYINSAPEMLLVLSSLYLPSLPYIIPISLIYSLDLWHTFDISLYQQCPRDVASCRGYGRSCSRIKAYWCLRPRHHRSRGDRKWSPWVIINDMYPLNPLFDPPLLIISHIYPRWHHLFAFYHFVYSLLLVCLWWPWPDLTLHRCWVANDLLTD